jgi:hypothetical protein
MLPPPMPPPVIPEGLELPQLKHCIFEEGPREI